MDHFKIVKRAGNILWNYRMLWVFGIILALVASGGGSSGGSGSRYQVPGDEAARLDLIPENLPFDWPEIYSAPWPPRNWVAIAIGVGVGIACLVLIMAVVTTIVRNVVRTSLIRMVDEYEETGEKLGFKAGWRLGWTRRAFRMWLINLILDVPVAIVMIVLILMAGAPALLWLTGQEILGIIGTVGAVGLFFLVILLAIVVGVVITLLKRFFWRRAVLEEDTVGDSFREGFGLVKRHLKDVALMWLLMVGIGLVWTIAMIPVAVIVVLLFVIVGTIIAAVPGLIAVGIASIFTNGVVPWIIGAIVAAPVFILVISAPFVFLSGLYEAFKSIVWTLTYREVKALEPGVADDYRSISEEGLLEPEPLTDLSDDDSAILDD